MSNEQNIPGDEIFQEGLMPKAEIPPKNTEGEIHYYGMTPEAELPSAPPSQPQQPAPEGKDGGGKK